MRTLFLSILLSICWGAHAIGVGEIVYFDNSPVGHFPPPVAGIGDYTLAKVIKIWPAPDGKVYQLVAVNGGTGFNVNERDELRMMQNSGECLRMSPSPTTDVYYSCVGDEIAEIWGYPSPDATVHVFTIRSFWGSDSLVYATIIGQFNDAKAEVTRGYQAWKQFRFNHHKLQPGQVFCRNSLAVVYPTNPIPNNPDVCEGDKVSYPVGAGSHTGQVVAFFDHGLTQVLDQDGTKIFPKFVVKE